MGEGHRRARCTRADPPPANSKNGRCSGSEIPSAYRWYTPDLGLYSPFGGWRLRPLTRTPSDLSSWCCRERAPS